MSSPPLCTIGSDLKSAPSDLRLKSSLFQSHYWERTAHGIIIEAINEVSPAQHPEHMFSNAAFILLAVLVFVTWCERQLQ